MNDIIFKGYNDCIRILLDKEKKFEQIKHDLANKISSSKNFFINAGCAYIKFVGYDLSSEQELELLDVISSQTGISIIKHRLEEVMDVTTQDITTETKNNYDELLNKQENTTRADYVSNCGINSDDILETNCIVYNNSLRSGQFIHYNGTVGVFGDINSGSEIIAGGNIIVMGKIKGLVHAGCNGNKNFVINAMSFMPVQIRIANIITCIPKPITEPCSAYIKDGKLYLSVY
jgi:septum site-determining protein MinC